MKGHQMYGNANGLPGLPKTTYVAIGNSRPQPTRAQMRTVPPPAPMISRPLPAPLPRPAPIMIPQGPDPTLSRRIDTVESRIISTEQSNRTLLDELMRLQTEIKGNVRRNELSIQEERDARSRLEMGIRQSQQKNYDSEERLKRCEDGMKDNREAVQQLSIHVNNIEKMINSLKQDHMATRGGSSRQLTEYKNDISRLATDNDQLEKIVKNIQGDNRDNAARIDRLVSDVSVLSNQLRLQSKLMEDNAKKPVPVPREAGVDQRIIDNERTNTESKIMQLNKTIQGLSDRLRDESKKREDAEQFYKNELNSITGDLTKSKNDNDKKQTDYDQKMAEIRNGFNETDKRQMKTEMSRISTELNQKIDKNDERLRGETLNKLNVIEKTLKTELEKIGDSHKDLHGKIDTASNDLLRSKDGYKSDLDSAFEKQSKKHKDVLQELNTRMNEIEEAFRTNKLEQERVLEIEISERLKNDKILDAKIDDLEDDVQLGFVTIQNQQTDPDKKKQKGSKETTQKSSPSIDYDEIKAMQDDNANGVRKHIAKEVGNLETRIAVLETELRQKEDKVHNKLESSKAKEKENAAVMGDNLQQQIDALIIKHGKLKKQVDALSSPSEDTPKNLQTFKEQTTISLEELTAGLKKEKESRKANVDQINKDIDKIVGQKDQGDIPSLAQLNLDVDQTQTGLKKCAESIHVVKKIMTEKVADEKKLREKEFAILTSDVDRLDTKIKDLKERVKGVKGTNNPALDDEDFL